MSVNEKTLLSDDQALDPSFALRPSTAIIESGNGEYLPSAQLAVADTAAAPQMTTYLHAIRRHWLLATALGLLLAATAGVSVWLIMGARYTADAFLQCNFQQERYLEGQRYYRQPTMEEFENFKNTQMQYMQNRLVLTAALRASPKIGDEKVPIAKLPELADENDKADWLMRKISVSFPGKGEVMKVSVTTKDPVHSAAIVTAVVSAYYSEVVEEERKKRSVQIDDLKRIYEDKSQEYKSNLNELKKIADQLGTSDTEVLNIKQQNTLAELALVRGEFVRSQFELNRMRSELAAQQATMLALDTQSVSDLEVQAEAQADSVIRELGPALVWQKQQQDNASERLKAGAAQRAYDVIGRMRKEYNDRIEQLRQEVGAKRKAEVERKIKSLEASIKLTTDQQKATEEDVTRLRKEADKYGNTSIEMQMRRDDNKNQQKTLESIKSQLDALYVEFKAPARILKVQDGIAETPKTETGFVIRVAMAGMLSFLGFCLPFFGLVVWDLQSNHINGTSDVTDRLGLPVIGSVPKIPLRILHHQGPPQKSHQTWQLRLTESVDGISARLLRRAEIDQRRVVMVTSAVNGEGKTTLACQLAMSLARAGRRTLLVDFDLRSPTFDEWFGLPNAPGLCEILRNESDLAGCIHATGTDNLSVLTAGYWDRFALAALANNSVASLFKELREDYEFVIVDTSPILPIADARFISQYVDSVVLCVFRDISQAPRIRAACEILEAFGVQSVEAVVTGVNEHLGGRHLGYYKPVETAAS